jgi:hypothetical protein
MSDPQSPARRPRGRPPRDAPSEQAHQRLEPEIADWFYAEAVRTGVPAATLQKMVLTRYARERIRAQATSQQPRESRFARSRYVEGG